MGALYWIHNIVLYSLVIYSIHSTRKLQQQLYATRQHLQDTVECMIELTTLNALCPRTAKK